MAKYIEDADSTRRNYFTVLDAQTKKLFNENVYQLTIGGDQIDLDDTERPIAIIFRSREYSPSDDVFSSLFIESIYKSLSQRRENIGFEKGLSCARPFNFIIDEFGNIFPINNLDKKLTVGRSNRIYFNFYLQNYEQLEKAYKDVYMTIESNTTHYFMGTNSSSSKKIFCEHAGERMIPEAVDFDLNPTAPLHLIRTPVISVSEIENLPPYSAYMKTHNDVLKVSFIPSYCYEKEIRISHKSARKDSPRDYCFKDKLIRLFWLNGSGIFIVQFLIFPLTKR